MHYTFHDTIIKPSTIALKDYDIQKLQYWEEKYVRGI